MTATEITPTVRLWSVTTLIKQGLGTNDAIVNWAAKITAEGAVDRLSSWKGMVDSGDRDGAVDYLTGLRRRRQKKALERGSEIHAIAEKLALGEDPGPISDEHRPYVEQLAGWIRANRPRYLMAEAPIYNLTWGYAGTCDGILELQGRRFLFDYKTTEYPPGGEKARPPWPEAALQIAAYSRAELVGVLSEQRYDQGRRFYVYDPAAHHEPMPEVDGALCIVLSPYDCTPYVVRIDDLIWEAFLDVRNAARWTLSTSRSGLFLPLQPEGGTT